MDNQVASESDDIESGATSAVCVPLLAGTVLSCALLNCTPPVRIRICFFMCFSSLSPLQLTPAEQVPGRSGGLSMEH